MNVRTRCLVLCICLFLIASVAATAQTFRGSIEGTVTDNSGAAIPGADVKVTSTDTGLTRSTVSNDLGAYSVTELPGGTYTVTVSKSGFKSLTQKGVFVGVGSTP